MPTSTVKILNVKMELRGEAAVGTECLCSTGLNNVNNVKRTCLLSHLLYADASRKFGRVHTHAHAV